MPACAPPLKLVREAILQHLNSFTLPGELNRSREYWKSRSTQLPVHGRKSLAKESLYPALVFRPVVLSVTRVKFRMRFHEFQTTLVIVVTQLLVEIGKHTEQEIPVIFELTDRGYADCIRYKNVCI